MMDVNTKMLNLLQPLSATLRQRRQTLALAESCTGGLLAACITSQAGVSDFFLGAVVSYSAGAKKQCLGVADSLLAVHGEVSIPVAREMAQGAKLCLGSHWALSMTGIAGPTGGSVDKPVGTVCFGLVGPGVEQALRAQIAGASRQEVQWNTAIYALELILASMQSYTAAPN